MLTNILLLDIETVPQAETFTAMATEWQSLFKDKITKTVPEELDWEEMYRRKAGILAEFGKIICISTAVFYQDADKSWALKIKSLAGKDEVQILRDFTDLCNQMHHLHPKFIFGGHNIKEFDIPYICRRMLINGLSLPDYLQLHDKKPWEVNMFDTLNWWKFGDQKNYVSLNLLAHVLGIPTSKIDMDGSKVQDVYYLENNLNRIIEYCQLDVVVTANIMLKFKGLPFLTENKISMAVANVR